MTLAMALSLDVGGRIITCDAASGWSEMGIHFWRSARVDGFIERRIGRAAEVLEGLLREGERGKFDLVYLDADGGQYESYLDPVTQLLRQGGLPVAGGVLAEGRAAAEAADDEEIIGLRAFNRRLHGEDGYFIAMLPVGSGMTLAIKK